LPCGGGGIHCLNANTLISGCLIYKNTSGDAGGGIMASGNSIITLINNTIAYNSTKASGGGIAVNINNFSDKMGRFIGKNNIIYGNTSPDNLELGKDVVRNGEYAQLTYTCITSYREISGEGNIYTDPLFVNPGKDDFHLKKNSPCIHAGKKQDGKSVNMGAL
jgi:hypothetical protein